MEKQRLVSIFGGKEGVAQKPQEEPELAGF